MMRLTLFCIAFVVGCLQVHAQTTNEETLNSRMAAIQTTIKQRSDALQSFQNNAIARLRSIEADQRDSLMAVLNAEYDTLQSQYIQAIKDGCEANRDNNISVRLLSKFYNQLGMEYVEAFLKDYPQADASELEPVRAFIVTERSKRPGAELIDFELPDAVGTPHRLSEYIGKGTYVLVDFWASWCGPCRAEMPNVQAAYEKYHDRGFDILGLSFDQDREAWMKAVTDLKMNWPQLSDLKGWNSLAAKKYAIHGIPFTLLFDPEGHVVEANLRGPALGQMLEKLLPTKP